MSWCEEIMEPNGPGVNHSLSSCKTSERSLINWILGGMLKLHIIKLNIATHFKRKKCFYQSATVKLDIKITNNQKLYPSTSLLKKQIHVSNLQRRELAIKAQCPIQAASMLMLNEPIGWHWSCGEYWDYSRAIMWSNDSKLTNSNVSVSRSS